MKRQGRLVIRPVGGGDYAQLVDVHCPELKGLPRGERIRRCGWWADEEASRRYISVLRSLGGEAYVAVEGVMVLGEVEVLSHPDCLLGPGGYLQVLWVRPGF